MLAFSVADLDCFAEKLTFIHIENGMFTVFSIFESYQSKHATTESSVGGRSVCSHRTLDNFYGFDFTEGHKRGFQRVRIGLLRQVTDTDGRFSGLFNHIIFNNYIIQLKSPKQQALFYD